GRALGEAGDARGVVGGKPLELAQDEHLAVLGGERGQDAGQRLGVQQAIDEPLVFDSPAGGPSLLAQGYEGRRIVRPAPVAAIDGVAGDGQQPGAGRGVVAKTTGGPPGGEEGFLEGHLGVRLIVRQGTREAKDCSLMTPDEPLEGGTVSRRRAADQRRVADPGVVGFGVGGERRRRTGRGVRISMHTDGEILHRPYFRYRSNSLKIRRYSSSQLVGWTKPWLSTG